MKNLFFKTFILLSFLFVCNTISAQYNGGGYDVLGVWCYGDIYIKKAGSSDDLKCTIPVPTEGLYPHGNAISGPGAPYLTNYLGSTVDIAFNAPAQIKVELDMQDGDIGYELYTNERVTNSFGDINGTYKYYYVIIHVHFID